MDERLTLGIHHDICRAQSGDTCAGALLADYARLKLAAGEPLPWQLREDAPRGYEPTPRNEEAENGSL